MTNKGIILLSGGLDSATVAAMAIKEGFIQRTPRGREVTDLAYEHLKIPRNRKGDEITLF